MAMINNPKSVIDYIALFFQKNNDGSNFLKCLVSFFVVCMRILFHIDASIPVALGLVDW